MSRPLGPDAGAGARRTRLAIVAATVLAAAATVAVLVQTAVDAAIVHQERSMYRTILVVDEGDERCLRFGITSGAASQSCQLRDGGKRLVLDYTQMIVAGLLVRPAPVEILIAGLGGGTLPGAYADLLPDARVTTVEIDPAVVDVARRYFGYRESDRVRTVVGDARVFVKRALGEARRYDLVVLDAFTGDYIPEHLMTREFLGEVRALLTPAGLVVANTFSASRLYHHESVTYEAVFPHLVMLRAPGGNRVLYAAPAPVAVPAEDSEPVRRLQARLAAYGVDLKRLLAMRQAPDWDRKARILTDRYSPANVLRGRPGGDSR